MASAFLVKDYAQTNVLVWIYTNHERVCLYMHHFCSFDNWLCNPISANWQLTLSLKIFFEFVTWPPFFSIIHLSKKVAK